MLNKNTLLFGAAVLTAIVIGGGWWAYDAVQGDTEAASGPITAIPITVNTVVPPTETSAQTIEPATAEASPTADEAGAVGESAATAAQSTTQSSGLTTFQILQDGSEASFSIYEELNGQPKTVVGATNQVAGEIALDLSDLSKTQVGVIQVNARTLATDNDRRNRAIRNFILNTDQYEFITFTPTAITGLSGAAQPGQPFTFQIAGDLTIRDVTQPVVFNVTAQGESLMRITGTATAVVRRSDYNLTIPSVPNVANVGEEVTLEIDFVAEAITAASTTSANTSIYQAATTAPTAAPSNSANISSETTSSAAKLNLNTASADDFLTIPDVGNRMVREFMEYRPYVSIQQFRREIGKYVDEAQVAEYEKYVYVPIAINDSDAATLQQIPGLDATEAAELIAGRPYASTDAFLAKAAEYVSEAELSAAKSYLSG